MELENKGVTLRKSEIFEVDLGNGTSICIKPGFSIEEEVTDKETGKAKVVLKYKEFRHDGFQLVNNKIVKAFYKGAYVPVQEEVICVKKFTVKDKTSGEQKQISIVSKCTLTSDGKHVVTLENYMEVAKAAFKTFAEVNALCRN